MKITFLVPVLLALTLTPSPAEETAYSALRVVGRTQGKETLNHVLELRGRAGSPQPAVWKITLDEPRARGGVREVEVQRGKIISERTPTSARITGGPMNFTQLNLDSDGVFTIANQEAQKAGVPFDHVDYVLRSGSGSGAPVWQLTLSDTKLGPAGSIDIAADTGAVLEKRLTRPAANQPSDDRAYLNDNRPPPTGNRNPQPPRNTPGGYSQSGEPFRGVDDFFHRVGKRFEKRGTQIENFFTGKDGPGENTNTSNGR